MLLCIFAAAASVDMLAAVIPTDKSVPWWGAPQSSSSGPSVLTDERVHLASCDLLLSVKSSQLTATYTITTASTSSLAKKLDAADTATENSQVSGLIGYIVIAEFKRGFTGQNHSWRHLDFGPPKLNVAGRKTEIKITSYPIQLQLSTQLISVFRKPAEIHADAENISLDVKGLQLNNDTGMTLDSMSSNQATVTPVDSTVSFTITEDSQQNEWLMLLRAKGGIFIPIFNNLLSGLGTYLIYSLLLLGFASAASAFPDNRVIATGRDVLFTVVAAFITGYVLELLTEIDTRIHNSYIRPQTGAIALLLGGLLLIWPKACLAAGREARAGSDGHHASPGRKFYLLIALALLAEPLFYWTAVHAVWHVNPVAHPAGLTASVVASIVTLVLTAEILPSAGKVTIGLISVAGLAILLTASIVAPILTFQKFTGDHFHEPHVNLSAKLIYLMAALLLVGGLSIMSYRIVQSLGYGPLKSRLTWAVISIIIVVTIIPDIVENSRITAAHAQGPSVSAFFGLIFSLPQLLDWLVLALAVTVVMTLPERTDSWPCARHIAIPVSLMLLYANVTWLYIPVTLIAGAIAVTVLVLPRRLTKVRSSRIELGQALDDAIDARRRAGLAADQSQRLNARAATMPEHPHNPKSLSYEEIFESLAVQQGFLAKEKAEQKAKAQDFRAKAFGGQGWPPDKTTAKKAALLGICLGIIPAAISIITRQNIPSDNPYFFLHFFGGAAWGILIWPLLGWFIGYFRPIIRGSSGMVKALWIILAYLIGALPMDIIWNSPNAWLNFLVNLSVFGSFTLLSCVVICEIMPLRAAERNVAGWLKVNNWHFIVGWSTALLAALGTAGVTFLSTAATDLSHQTVTVVTGSSTGYNPGSAP